LKTIVTITMNPTIDKSSRVQNVVAEKKLYCKPPRFEPGGGGINVSRAIKKLGGESMLLYPAGGLTGEKLKELLNEEDLVASGSLPPGVPADFYAQLARVGKDRGAKVIVDTSGEALEKACREGVYMIKPNIGEFRKLAGKNIKEESQIKAEAQNMVEKGLFQVLIISLGAAGALMVTKDSSLHIRRRPYPSSARWGRRQHGGRYRVTSCPG
jgi:6-phosphofructokinase 2